MSQVAILILDDDSSANEDISFKIDRLMHKGVALTEECHCASIQGTPHCLG